MDQSKYKTFAVAKQDFIKKYRLEYRPGDVEKDLDELIKKAQEEKVIPLGFYKFNWGKNDI